MVFLSPGFAFAVLWFRCCFAFALPSVYYSLALALPSALFAALPCLAGAFAVSVRRSRSVSGSRSLCPPPRPLFACPRFPCCVCFCPLPPALPSVVLSLSFLLLLLCCLPLFLHPCLTVEGRVWLSLPPRALSVMMVVDLCRPRRPPPTCWGSPTAPLSAGLGELSTPSQRPVGREVAAPGAETCACVHLVS